MNTYTERTAAAVIARMLKSKHVSNRPALQNTWIDEKGRQCACDGFRAYRLKAPVPGLPDMPENVEPIALQKVFDEPETRYTLPLDVPGLDDVKNLIAVDKEEPDKNRRGLYFFGHGLPAVNLHYLRDMLQMFPDGEFFWSGSTVNALYIKSAYGDGLLLPIRLLPKDGAPLDDSPRIIPQKKKAAAPAFSLAAFAARFAA